MKKKIVAFLIITLMLTSATLSVIGSSTYEDNNDWKAHQEIIPKISPLDFIGWFIERFPNAFPIFKYILVVSGFLNGLVKKGTGKLILQITDAPDLNITEALVTISQIRVHYAGINQNDTNGTWIVVTNESQTFDLIQIQNATEFLGEVNLTAGWYTQIRLFVEEALVTIDGIQYDLKIPSKNVKLITSWLVQDNETLTLTLDFDVQKSVHETGNGKYIMRPTIKVIQE